MRTARRLLTLAMLSSWMVLPGLPTPAETQTKPRRAARAPVDSVLVRIGKENITTGMVQRRLEELPEHVRPQFTTPEGRRQLLDRMVEERVWLLVAIRSGVADRPEIRRQIEQQRRDLLIRTHINELMAETPTPSEAEVSEYYEARLDDYRTPATVTLSHIQCKTEAEAKRVKQWAKSGQDWAKLTARYSADTLTRARGGVLGSVTRDGVFGHLGPQPALAESALALSEGAIGGPYRTDRGWHVIRVDALKPEGTRPLEQVRGSIMRQLSARNSQDFYQSKLAEAKELLGVRPDSSAIEKYLSQKKSARDMFNEAQAAGPTDARIEAYRQLLKEYPDSEVSPQAQFMIGFIQSEELKDYVAAERSFQELLGKYPKSELAASARWMLEHMRSETAPEFMNLEADSTQAPGPDSNQTAGGKSTPSKGPSGKP